MEGEDYYKLDSPNLANQNGHGGDRRSITYFLNINTAKEIAMVENNPQGRTIRLYLIKVEEAWNTPEAVMARALQFAQQKLETYQQEIETPKPRRLIKLKPGPPLRSILN